MAIQVQHPVPMMMTMKIEIQMHSKVVHHLDLKSVSNRLLVFDVEWHVVFSGVCLVTLNFPR